MATGLEPAVRMGLPVSGVTSEGRSGARAAMIVPGRWGQVLTFNFSRSSSSAQEVHGAGRGKAAVRAGMQWPMRETHHQAEAMRLRHEPCANRRAHVPPEASALLPADAPDRALKEWNPLHTNDLRPRITQTPGKKETLAPQRLTPNLAIPRPSFPPRTRNPRKNARPCPQTPYAPNSDFFPGQRGPVKMKQLPHDSPPAKK